MRKYYRLQQQQQQQKQEQHKLVWALSKALSQTWIDNVTYILYVAANTAQRS